MSRADPFTRSDIEWRHIEAGVYPRLIESLTDKAPIIAKKGFPTLEAAKQRFAQELCCAIWVYRARVIADKQERPARIVATLKQGEKLAKKLLEWLNSLPPRVRFELRAEGIECLLNDLAVLLDALGSNATRRSTYWQSHVASHRPSGAANASRDLRQSLIDLVTRFSPDNPLDDDRAKRKNKGNRIRWVATAAKAIGARYPDEKKNLGRFIGKRAGDPQTRSAIPPKQGHRKESKEVRERNSRLAKITL
jgi:hypothetical protein